MRKNFSHWAIQICQNEVFISSPFSGKNKDYFLQYLGYFYQETGQDHKSKEGMKILQILFYTNDFSSTSCKKVLVQIFSGFTASYTKDISEKFQHGLSNLAGFLDTIPTFRHS